MLSEPVLGAGELQLPGSGPGPGMEMGPLAALAALAAAATAAAGGARRTGELLTLRLT